MKRLRNAALVTLVVSALYVLVGAPAAHAIPNVETTLPSAEGVVSIEPLASDEFGAVQWEVVTASTPHEVKYLEPGPQQVICSVNGAGGALPCEGTVFRFIASGPCVYLQFDGIVVQDIHSGTGWREASSDVYVCRDVPECPETEEPPVVVPPVVEPPVVEPPVVEPPVVEPPTEPVPSDEPVVPAEPTTEPPAAVPTPDVPVVADAPPVAAQEVSTSADVKQLASTGVSTGWLVIFTGLGIIGVGVLALAALNIARWVFAHRTGR